MLAKAGQTARPNWLKFFEENNRLPWGQQRLKKLEFFFQMFV